MAYASCRRPVKETWLSYYRNSCCCQSGFWWRRGWSSMLFKRLQRLCCRWCGSTRVRICVVIISRYVIVVIGSSNCNNMICDGCYTYEWEIILFVCRKLNEINHATNEWELKINSQMRIFNAILLWPENIYRSTRYHHIDYNFLLLFILNKQSMNDQNLNLACPRCNVILTIILIKIKKNVIFNN